MLGRAALVAEAAQPHHQFHVLADGVVQPAAGRDHRLAAEQPERAGDDEVAAQAVQAEPAEQERAQVLDHLDAGEPGARHGHVDARWPCRVGTALTGRIVPPVATTSRVDEHRPHQAHQRAALDQRVGVDGADQLAAGQVEPDVQRIGLAAVQLVHDHQVGVAQRPVERHHALGRARAARRRGSTSTSANSRLQDVDRVVLAAVGDDHDLEIRVVERQQRLHAGGDGRFLVVGRRQDADRRRQPRADDDVVVDADGLVAGAAHLDHRRDEQRDVADVEQPEVDEHGGVDRPGHASIHAAAWPLTTMTPARGEVERVAGHRRGHLIVARRAAGAGR